MLVGKIINFCLSRFCLSLDLVVVNFDIFSVSVVLVNKNWSQNGFIEHVEIVRTPSSILVAVIVVILSSWNFRSSIWMLEINIFCYFSGNSWLWFFFDFLLLLVKSLFILRFLLAILPRPHCNLMLLLLQADDVIKMTLAFINIATVTSSSGVINRTFKQLG